MTDPDVTEAEVPGADATGAGSPRVAVLDAERPANRYVSDYTDLAKAVRGSGLMRRRYWYYWLRLTAVVLAFAGLWVAIPLIGASWFQLLIAAAMGLVITQIGFLAHDGAHRQIFASAAWNDWCSRILSGAFIGLSVGWWKSKHGRHHASPNQIGRDPDISPGVVAFTAEAVAERRAWTRWLVRRQGWLLLPLLTLEGLNLFVGSLIDLAQRRASPHRWTELALITTRTVVYLGLLFFLLPPGMGFAFLGVQMAVLGVTMGGAFAPNHIGMPVVPADLRIDFLRRQVLMSRNISGGWPIAILMGGLEFQIEHHLFPSMPRPALKEVRGLVRGYCRERGVAYTEVGLLSAYRSLLSHLNRVGLRDHDVFACPLAAATR